MVNELKIYKNSLLFYLIVRTKKKQKWERDVPIRETNDINT